MVKGKKGNVIKIYNIIKIQYENKLKSKVSSKEPFRVY